MATKTSLDQNCYQKWAADAHRVDTESVPLVQVKEAREFNPSWKCCRLYTAKTATDVEVKGTEKLQQCTGCGRFRGYRRKPLPHIEARVDGIQDLSKAM